jgi:serine protease Do
MTKMLSELQDAIVAAADTTGAAVVTVGRGAGMVIATNRILTNAHNLTGPTAPVRFADGRSVDAELTAADIDGDLAVLTADTGDVAPVSWAEQAPTLWAAVLALGPPRRGPARVTVGFVSTTERTFRGPRGRRLTGMEHTAPVGRGSSGGPVVDVQGRVVGIDTHRRGEGFYLALPVSPQLRERIQVLAGGETPARRHLGVTIAPTEVARRLRRAVGLTERDGVLVREVEDESPAAHAGLQEGDLIVGAGGSPVVRPDDLLEAVDRGDDPLPVAVVRGEQELELDVIFGRDV